MRLECKQHPLSYKFAPASVTQPDKLAAVSLKNEILNHRHACLF